MIKIQHKVSLVICAYNEEKNIHRVLDVVSGLSWIDEIIVVNDGSEDKTREVVEKYKLIKLINHKTNLGKGAAIASGVKASKFELLLFLDADLIGLSETHLKQLLSPIVFSKEADLVLGIFGKGEITATNIANKLIPSITGQRAIKKKNLPDIEKMQAKRYGVDIFITKSIVSSRIKVVKLDKLSQVIKEEKSDKIVQALSNRFIMYKDILDSLNKSKKDKKN